MDQKRQTNKIIEKSGLVEAFRIHHTASPSAQKSHKNSSDKGNINNCGLYKSTRSSRVNRSGNYKKTWTVFVGIVIFTNFFSLFSDWVF